MLYRRIKKLNEGKNIHPFGPIWTNDIKECHIFKVSYRKIKGSEEIQKIIPKSP